MPYKYVSEKRRKSIFQENIIIDYELCHIPIKVFTWAKQSVETISLWNKKHTQEKTVNLTLQNDRF